jgi:hypothetical protein
VTYVFIDPDGVLAMSGATLAASVELTTVAAELQGAVDSVSDLVGGGPNVQARAAAMAGDLAELSGWARAAAVHYVDHEKPLNELATLGYWLPDFGKLGLDGGKTAGQNAESLLRSDEFGAFVLGTGGELLDRYRRSELYVVESGADLEQFIPKPGMRAFGRNWVDHPSGFTVVQGSSVDPYRQQIAAAADGPDVTRHVSRGLVGDPDLARPPAWARTTSRGVFVVGAALSVYDAGASQWESDATYHPEYSRTERVASAGYNATMQGGGAVAGGYFGAELGAAVGTMVFPGVGTVVGGVAGGVVGSFVGSKAGKGAGSILKELGSGAADMTTAVWHSTFG